MSAAEDDLSGYIDREEPHTEGNGDGEASDESNVSDFNGQDGVSEPETRPLPEEANLTSETPTGVEEDRILQSQEKAALESKIKTREQRRSPKPAQDKSTSKLQNELKKQIDRSRSLEDSVKGIQRQLVRIDKALYSVKKEHDVIRKKHAQLNSLQRRIDSIDKSMKIWKSKPKAAKRKTKPKLTIKKNK
jgi:predicted  nucleic acid-binding Zn-ribbon protein